MWVGLLFGMLCLAVMATGASSPNPTPGNEADEQRLQIELYREKIVQCLIMGEYSKAGPHVLEAVVHYVYVEMLFSPDSCKDMWYLLALEVNLAKRMGYHRDPSHFSSLSPLEAEMRRRLWVTVLLGDILISSQMGMPRMIVDGQCDTSEPRNLYDSDFDPTSSPGGSSALPPARPETENTTVIGVIALRRMLGALGAVSDLTATIKSCGYAEILHVDGILNDARANIPPLLKMRPMASSITDPPQLIMSRLFLGHLFYKGQIMLHRRFLRSQQDATAYSRRVCLDAALGALQIQHILDEETRPGGQLLMLRWRITSIMNHQFLTATMILCMLLQLGQTLQREEEVKKALRTTRTIWIRGSASSREAQKGADVVRTVLARFDDQSPVQEDPSFNKHDASVQDDGFPSNLNSNWGNVMFQDASGQSARKYISMAFSLAVERTLGDAFLELTTFKEQAMISWGWTNLETRCLVSTPACSLVRPRTMTR